MAAHWYNVNAENLPLELALETIFLAYRCSERQAELIVSLVKPAGRVWLMPDGNEAGERCAQSLLLKVSPYRFVRWVKLGEDKQPTDLSPEKLKTSFTP